jgi:hypothetical protein
MFSMSPREYGFGKGVKVKLVPPAAIPAFYKAGRDKRKKSSFQT